MCDIMLGLIALVLAISPSQASYPYFALGTCNVTCSACSDKTAPNYCLGCEASLTLNSADGTCSIPLTDRTSYLEMFGDIRLQNSSQTLTDWQKYSVVTTAPLSTNDIKGCCNPTDANYFNFDLAGLFNSTFAISREFSFDYDLESVQLLFRAFYFIAPIKFTATLNTDQAISETIDATLDAAPYNLTAD